MGSDIQACRAAALKVLGDMSALPKKKQLQSYAVSDHAGMVPYFSAVVDAGAMRPELKPFCYAVPVDGPEKLVPSVRRGFYMMLNAIDLSERFHRFLNVPSSCLTADYSSEKPVRSAPKVADKLFDQALRDREPLALYLDFIEQYQAKSSNSRHNMPESLQLLSSNNEFYISPEFDRLLYVEVAACLLLARSIDCRKCQDVSDQVADLMWTADLFITGMLVRYRSYNVSLIDRYSSKVLSLPVINILNKVDLGSELVVGYRALARCLLADEFSGRIAGIFEHSVVKKEYLPSARMSPGDFSYFELYFEALQLDYELTSDLVPPEVKKSYVRDYRLRSGGYRM